MAASMSGPILEAENISVSFCGRKIFDGLSFSVKRGGKLVIDGPSGSGKSTLLKMLMGFIRPESGRIRVGGEALSPESVWRIRRKAALVLQEPDLGEGVVEDILRRPFAFRANRHLKQDEDRLNELFESFLLDKELRHKDISLLSGGEKQRVALICALLLEKEIYLLDEVSSALDARSKKAVFDIFCRRRDMTVIAATHDRDFISSCDQALVLKIAGKRGRRG